MLRFVRMYVLPWIVVFTGFFLLHLWMKRMLESDLSRFWRTFWEGIESALLIPVHLWEGLELIFVSVLGIVSFMTSWIGLGGLYLAQLLSEPIFKSILAGDRRYSQQQAKKPSLVVVMPDSGG